MNTKNCGGDIEYGALVPHRQRKSKEVVSNNFGSFPARRNPARVAKIDGGMAEAEAAGGSPRKKPHGPSPRKKPPGEETFLFRLDRGKETAEHDGRTEPIELEDDPDD